MQALENKVIIYDDVCPMCKGYTACFIHFGLLKKRSGFAAASPELLENIDLDRARHEIPLYDLQTGKTLYGLDALFLILGERFPVLRPLFRNRFFRGALYQVYQLITYNRRIIAGSKAPATGFDCAPDVNLFYRWLYIGLALTASGLMLSPYLTTGSPAAAALGILHGSVALLGFHTTKKLDFAGHWMTMLLINAILWSILPNILVLQGGVLVFVLWVWWKRLSPLV